MTQWCARDGSHLSTECGRRGKAWDRPLIDEKNQRPADILEDGGTEGSAQRWPSTSQSPHDEACRCSGGASRSQQASEVCSPLARAHRPLLRCEMAVGECGFVGADAFAVVNRWAAALAVTRRARGLEAGHALDDVKGAIGRAYLRAWAAQVAGWALPRGPRGIGLEGVGRWRAAGPPGRRHGSVIGMAAAPSGCGSIPIGVV